ncbi:MAG: right-handed parallel beta-helix repeat-containing protein [Pseudomonadota bacterium]
MQSTNLHFVSPLTLKTNPLKQTDHLASNRESRIVFARMQKKQSYYRRVTYQLLSLLLFACFVPLSSVSGSTSSEPDGAEQHDVGITRNIVVTSVADLRNLKFGKDIRNNDLVSTLGYYADRDGGHAQYRIVEGDLPTKKRRLDGGHVLRASDRAFHARLLAIDNVNVKQFGAKGDGIHDDSKAFQLAVDYVPVGGTVTVPSGRFLLGPTKSMSDAGKPLDPNIIELIADHVPAGTYSWGAVKVESKRLVGTGTIEASKHAAHALLLSGSSPQVSGLTFASEKHVYNSLASACEIRLGQGCDNPVIESCRFESSARYYAVCAGYFGRVNREGMEIVAAAIRGNRFIGYVRQIYLNSTRNTVIGSNAFRNSLRDGIRTNNNSAFTVITGNTFHECGWRSRELNETSDGIDTNVSGESLVVSSNKFFRCGRHGIDIKGNAAQGEHEYSAGHSSRVQVIGNEFIECNHGVSVRTTGARRSTDNRWQWNTDIIIANNIISGSRSHGVGVYGSVKGVIISANTITSSQDTFGVLIGERKEDGGPLIGVQNATIADNMIFNNDGHGLAVYGAKHINITGNFFGQDPDMEYRLLPTAKKNRNRQRNRQRISIKINDETVKRYGGTYIIAHNQILEGQELQIAQSDRLPKIFGWPELNLIQ